MRCFDKRGQLTVFIMIGLILLVSFGLILTAQKKGAENDPEVIKALHLPEKLSHLNVFFDSCLKRATKLGIDNLAKNGGYIHSFEHVLYASEIQIAYHVQNDQIYSPEKYFMEQELSNFIETAFQVCINDEPTLNPYDIQFGKSQIKTLINEDEVIVDATYPLTLAHGTDKTTINKFYINIPSPLGKLINTAGEISEYLMTSDDVNFRTLASYDADISVLPYDEHSVVYSLTEKEANDLDKLKFNFAVKKK